MPSLAGSSRDIRDLRNEARDVLGSAGEAYNTQSGVEGGRLITPALSLNGGGGEALPAGLRDREPATSCQS